MCIGDEFLITTPLLLLLFWKEGGQIISCKLAETGWEKKTRDDNFVAFAAALFPHLQRRKKKKNHARVFGGETERPPPPRVLPPC